ncbi:MAG: ferredoxin:glutaredoxin reductase [Candidatus Bathyarchaeota archaeon]|nr:MAG: ferredoxin:glutaredoxin reductase [Candidatus Bathyarchaeota archaeon]
MTTLEEVRQRVESDAKSNGYYLNPDPEVLRHLLEGLRKNEERYDYPSCPCRLAFESFELDRDIICPCDYRDPDVDEYGSCYCSLFVSKDVFEGKIPLKPIPERRPNEKQIGPHIKSAKAFTKTTAVKATASIRKSSERGMKLFYCRQCGYVCFREEPPYLCPICKAKRELFAEVTIS